MTNSAEWILCPYCRESFLGDEIQRFCVTCDAWLHPECLHAHAKCEPDPEGKNDWRHVDGA